MCTSFATIFVFCILKMTLKLHECFKMYKVYSFISTYMYIIHSIYSMNITYTLCLCLWFSWSYTQQHQSRIIFLFPHFLQQACLSFNISCTLPFTSLLSAGSLSSTHWNSPLLPVCFVRCTVSRLARWKAKLLPCPLPLVRLPACFPSSCLLASSSSTSSASCASFVSISFGVDFFVFLVVCSQFIALHQYVLMYTCVCRYLCMHSNLINKSMNATDVRAALIRRRQRDSHEADVSISIDSAVAFNCRQTDRQRVSEWDRETKRASEFKRQRQSSITQK